MASGKGTVKQVLSGDSVVVVGAPVMGPPPEKTFSMAGIMAPKVARPLQGVRDEPFAFPSREFLRRKLVGKQVTFRVEYTNPNIKNREFGTLMLGEENVAATVVAEGWARVKPLQGRASETPDYQELSRLEAVAQAEGRGMWTKKEGASQASIRELKTESHAEEFYDGIKGKEIDGIVEYVRDGASMRILLQPSCHIVQVFLAGIQCPGFRRAEVEPPPGATPPAPAEGETPAASQESPQEPSPPHPPQPQPQAQPPMVADPFAEEAKYFTETRMLGRDVKVQVVGMDKFHNFFGVVLVPQGNVAVELLKNGMAKVVSWSISMLSPEKQTELRQAERMGKERRLRLWKDWVPPPSKFAEKEFIGRVAEIVSGDTLMIVDPSNREHRIVLSSIRSPKMGNVRQGTQNQAYAYEAREFLRSHAIGKKVKVILEYTREFPIQQGGEGEKIERTFGTVIMEGSNLNLALGLVREGYATLVRHRGDEDRATAYDALLEAEKAATKAKKGLHGDKDAPKHRCNDLTMDSSKAKGFLTFLQRDKRHRAIVEFIFTGARYKLLIPAQSCYIMFSLSGVRCPAMGRREGTKSEPYAEDAVGCAKQACFQREVDVEVEAVDRNGCFLGSMFVDKKNFALQLLTEGLGKINPMGAERSAYFQELKDAEDAAKKKKLRLHEDYVDEEEVALADTEDGDVAEETLEIRASDIVDGGHFYAHVTGEETLATIEKKLQELSVEPDPVHLVETFRIRNGVRCMAKYDVDGCFYRAKIEGAAGENKWRVLFVDYGNTEVVLQSSLRPLPDDVRVLPPQAIECFLAFVKVPSLDEEFGEEAGHFLNDLAWNKPLTARVAYRDGDKVFVRLFEGDTDLVQKMAEEGLARMLNIRRIPKRIEEKLTDLRTAESKARGARLRLWQYGDVCDDEADEGDYPSLVFKSKPKPKAWGK
eukprot:TRINITY_DN3956_c2_g1_i1.p1 TRINITY_DN3956_c2_g1~~TRINITY_DN3956_c2_g1_i1.p1  ORF type:complete len:934 (+),score=250.11 TRINITY_DN3956_c2_g1_i1:151-2952(+)